MQDSQKDFFISYSSADRSWAEWIAWQLEQEGYTTAIQSWDFLPGSNFVADMNTASQSADQIIAVLSPNYLNTLYTFEEWTAAFKRDPSGRQEILLPIHVRECRYKLRGLLESIAYIDLVGQDEPSARIVLLAGVRHERAKPTTHPMFPTVPHTPSKRPAFPNKLAPLWNVPYPRNPFFTGREELLTQLFAALKAGQTMALTQPQAISGLGGIGKTHIAVEYAYRYRDEYHAVLWARADTHEALVSAFVSIAELLNLPGKDEQNQTFVVRAVKKWLTMHTGWLLILDNADDLEMVKEFIPRAYRGHLLLTTRAYAMGSLAQRIEVESMPPEEGALFLLRRAAVIASDVSLEHVPGTERAVAIQISKEMGGLPLALDQAGAYIEETACRLSDYLERYRKRSSAVLRRRGGLVADHPEPVASTWSLSFEKVEQSNAAAADLLRLCAFLYPEAIPEEVITEGVQHLGLQVQSIAMDPLALDSAIEDLRAYSLVRRDTEAKTLTVHRLVQAVLIDGMNEATRRQWAERTVRAVNEAFPNVEFSTWPLCQRILSHAQVCAMLIRYDNMTFLEAARLLTKTGSYLRERAEYAEAEPLYQQALSIHEQVLGPAHPDTASSLNNLAVLYVNQGKYAEAEPLYQRALMIRERELGPAHPGTATSLNNLAVLYDAQGKYAKAEPLYQQALAICESALGSEHPGTATSLDNLAVLYVDQGKYAKAEPLYQQALSIRERILGPEHPDTATSLDNLAKLYSVQKRFAKAESLYQRALTIRERMLGPEHPDTASSLNNLAVLYVDQGKYAEAESLYQRALSIREEVLGPEHPSTATSLNNLASLYEAQGKYAEAEPLYQRALTIRERVLGPEHPNTASSFYYLARLYVNQGKYAEAEPLYQRALMIYEQQLGPQHSMTIRIRKSYTELLRQRKS